MRKISHRTFQLSWLMAKMDFKLRYQGSVLGFFWALLKPLFLFAILNVVFSHLFSQHVPFYSLQLLMGILFWNFFAEGTSVGLMSMMSKSHILTKVSLPRSAVVLAASFQTFLTFLINLGLLMVAFILFELPLSFWQIFIFFFYIFLLYFLVLGFSFFAAPFFLRFRDFNQVWEVLLMGGFFTAPVIYPLGTMPSWLQPFLYLNPMTFLIEHARAVMFSSDFSRMDHHLLYFVFVLFLFCFGFWFFRKNERRVVELL